MFYVMFNLCYYLEDRPNQVRLIWETIIPDWLTGSKNIGKWTNHSWLSPETPHSSCCREIKEIAAILLTQQTLHKLSENSCFCKNSRLKVRKTAGKETNFQVRSNVKYLHLMIGRMFPHEK